MKHIVLLCISLMGMQLSAQEVSAVLKDKQIKIGEQTTIELSMRATADGRTVQFPDLLDTISANIEILEVSEIDTAYDEQDISIRILSQTITITSWDSGFHAVPPFVFFLGDQQIASEADLLEVISVPLAAEADIKDIKKIMEVPFSLWDWILVHKYWFLGGLALIILMILAWMLIKRFNKQSAEEQVVVPKEKADVLAIRQLQELESAALWQNSKINQYYTQLSHILREYLENRFQLSALEKTTDEIEMLLKYHKEVEAKYREQFIGLMQRCDMAKFAKQEPLASENKEAMKFAYRFVEDTKMVIEEKSDISAPLQQAQDGALDVTGQKSEMGSAKDDDRTRTPNSTPKDDSQFENLPNQESASKEEKSA